MNVIFVSSRNRGTEQDREQENRTVQISVPCELVMGLLAQGAILQMQIGPVPLRPDLARPAPRPDAANTRPDAANTRPDAVNTRPDASNTRPNAANANIRPDVANTNPKPISGRSEVDLTRPERPASRHPPVRPISPYTDWSSLSDQAEAEADVISIHSDDSDNNYIPRSPAYEPNSPGPNPVQEPKYWDPTPGEEAPLDQQAGPSRTCVFSNIFSDSRDKDASARPRSPLGRGSLLQRVSPFLRGAGQKRRNLGKIRPM